MPDHPDHTECWFIGPFTGLALVEMPLREVEGLHGWEHVREPDIDGVPQYRATGYRVEWRRAREYKSRAERRLGKMTFGESGD